MIFLTLFPFTLFIAISCKPQENKRIEFTPEIDFFRNNVPDSLKHLLSVLDSVFIADQKYRKGNDRNTYYKYKNEIHKLDSVNLTKIIPIIEKYGILGIQEIGGIGYSAIVLTIQHADLATQKKYLPLFREALKMKKVIPSTYAMLEDRVAHKNGQMQIYGTQVMLIAKGKAELLPVMDVDNIDKRRDSIGMKETIEIYLKRFGIKWDLEKYKKDMPRLMEKYQIKETN